MLSELQTFCIDAMGLSRGLPEKLPPQTKSIPPTIERQSDSLNLHDQSNGELSPIKRVIPNLDIPKINVSNKSSPKTDGIAPKDIQGLDNWHLLKSSINDCNFCSELSQSRSQTIFGSGHENADLMIISEAPSSDEDIQGKPFVGKSGTLLDNMLQSIDMERKNTFLTNSIKCMPPNNRDPHKDEAQACKAFLDAQINRVKPKLILALGRIAAQNLLNSKTPVGQLRGEINKHPISQIPIIVSYHPAYLLRNPAQKQKSWTDFKLVNDYLSSH